MGRGECGKWGGEGGVGGEGESEGGEGVEQGEVWDMPGGGGGVLEKMWEGLGADGWVVWVCFVEIKLQELVKEY